jgi:hypothetical protein
VHDAHEADEPVAGSERPALRAVPPAPSLPERVGSVVSGPYRSVTGFLNQRALARATLALPRTVKFIGSALATGEVAEAVKAPRLSIGLTAQAALDEALLAIALTPRRLPQPADYEEVAAEVAAAHRLYTRRGWISDPSSYHREPPALMEGTATLSRHWSPVGRYERLSYHSGFLPRSVEPGAERWIDYEPNHTAVANIMRHPDGPRPWVIAVHGFCMGSPMMDVRGLHINRLYGELGMNVAMPVLPLHGPRKVTRISGEPLLSFQFMNAVHGISQAVWDIRRLIGWIREQGATSVSLYGVSLGGYVVSLLAGLEEGIDGVVAGIPVSDFPVLFSRHSPAHVRTRAEEHRILDGTVDTVFKVVSPLSFPATVPHDRRFIYAGYADRLALPDQAHRLWRHWDEPSISWYAGNHVGYIWSRQVSDYVADSLSLAAGTPRADGSAVPAP